MDTHSVSLISTLVIVFASAIVGGLLAKRLRQPAILGYIGVGVVLGNLLSGQVDQSFLKIIADVGVTLLLFTIGVEFSFHRLRKVLGKVSLGVAVQMLACMFLFLLLLLWLGFGFLPSLFVAIAASLSSTALIVKIFSEQGELETVHGEYAIGWSVIQDLSVIPIMLLLPALVGVQANGSATLTQTILVVIISLVKAGFALGLVIFLGRIAIPKLLNTVAMVGSREIFLVTTIGLVFLAALVTYALGLSTALGAFIAGLVIAETSQNHAIFAEVRPLRDVFSVVFFVSLGMLLPVGPMIHLLPLLLGVTLVVLLVKWFFVFGLGRYMGYHRKTAFLVALALMQMSEFGFIIAKMGASQGVLNSNQYIFLVALTFFTMCVGTPLMANAHWAYYLFYRTVGKFLPHIFSNKQELTPNREELPIRDHIVICGYGRVGKYIGRALDMAKIPFLVVDYNHVTVADLRSRGIQVVYGDPADKDVLDYAQVDYARAIIIAIPDRHTQEMIISNALTLNRRIRIICRTHHEEDQSYLKSLGVQTVVQPEFEAAISVIERILPEFGISPDEVVGKITRLKIEHGLG